MVLPLRVSPIFCPLFDVEYTIYIVLFVALQRPLLRRDLCKARYLRYSSLSSWGSSFNVFAGKWWYTLKGKVRQASHWTIVTPSRALPVKSTRRASCHLDFVLPVGTRDPPIKHIASSYLINVEAQQTLMPSICEAYNILRCHLECQRPLFQTTRVRLL